METICFSKAFPEMNRIVTIFNGLNQQPAAWRPKLEKKWYIEENIQSISTILISTIRLVGYHDKMDSLNKNCLMFGLGSASTIFVDSIGYKRRRIFYRFWSVFLEKTDIYRLVVSQTGFKLSLFDSSREMLSKNILFPWFIGIFDDEPPQTGWLLVQPVWNYRH